MPRFGVGISGRADGSPLRPVADELLSWGYPAVEGAAEITIILGDRYESVLLAVEAVRKGYRIAHIHGGEVTYGSVDNKFRHAISTMAHIHFVTNVPASTFLRDLPDVVSGPIHLVSAPGLDNVARIMEEPASKTDEVLLTWHSPTAEADPVRGLLAIIEALKGYNVVWTGTNNDPGCEEIKRVINSAGYTMAEEMTPDQYLARARDAMLLIGNSSSAVIEGPTLRTPSVDVGSRQEGRAYGISVYHAQESALAIGREIERALRHTGPWDSPYGEPGGSRKIVWELLNWCA